MICKECSTNPPKTEQVREGYIRFTRMVNFGECSDCYKKIEFTDNAVILLTPKEDE